MMLVATVLFLLVGPLVLAVLGWNAGRSASKRAPTAAAPWRGSRMITSALYYTLAFNLTFFVQELFLVLPKAMTPGLQPTLYHNNHGWTGDNALAALFQGTGALATALVGLACLLALRAGRPRPGPARLFVLWMAYCGLMMALPQVVIGALSATSDVGMAMAYLQWSPATKTLAAWLALAAMAAVALALLRPALQLADDETALASAGARTRFIAQVIAVPMLLGTLLVIPFRVPREAVEVMLLPLIVGVPGVLWMLAGAWRVHGARAGGVAIGAWVMPLVAALLLLLVFQVVLRPGIAFY